LAVANHVALVVQLEQLRHGRYLHTKEQSPNTRHLKHFGYDADIL
jgi:hypothetical protein